MSALPPKADIDRRDGQVRLVPKSGLMRCNKKKATEAFICDSSGPHLAGAAHRPIRNVHQMC
jgi:hypothetical protein